MSDIEKLTIESDGDITLCDKNPNTKRDILKVVYDAFVASLGHENLGSVADEILRLRAENEKLREETRSKGERIGGYVNMLVKREAEIEKLRSALKLALEYWAHKQQRYKNRHPAWVQAANKALGEADE